MSTTTATFGQHAATTAKTAAPAKPRLGLYQRFINARLRQGKAQAAGVLARMSDTQLERLGFTVEQIQEVRRTGSVPMNFWG
ncbi:MAG: hypothetical protein AB7L90_15060 [Hyphomicrobiaceae bacterium]